MLSHFWAKVSPRPSMQPYPEPKPVNPCVVWTLFCGGLNFDSRSQMFVANRLTNMKCANSCTAYIVKVSVRRMGTQLCDRNIDNIGTDSLSNSTHYLPI